MISPEDFEAWREPRVGVANPTRMDNPLWASLVREAEPIGAYHVLQRFQRERRSGDRATWCFDRFGRSTTPLPDGRVVHIAGEHEDGYDPDFYIYNDVIVVAPDGEVAIHGYPYAAFPSTDFHTATLVDDAIWVVGSLGYGHLRRFGTTQVCRLELSTMAMTLVATTGDAPGWIHKHAATLEPGAIVIDGGLVQRGKGQGLRENVDAWALDLSSLTWTRRTQRDWPQWIMRRADGKRSALWDLRNLLGELDRGDRADAGFLERYRARVLEALGRIPDLELVRTLYAFDGAAALPKLDYNVFRVAVDGVTMRFTEHGHDIAAIVEGELAADRLAALQRHVLDRLDALESPAAWQLEA